MFHLYHHNDLGRLAELFRALRGRNRSAPLEADRVLVPNHGIGRWLTMQIAEQEGIAANIEAALPGGYIWRLLGEVSPETAQGAHFEPDGLPWHLYLALPVMAADIPAVADYLGTPTDEVRRWQLARQLADVFDKYLVYRGDMLAAWEQGDTPPDGPGRWQAKVWRYLTREDRLGPQHRARVLTDFVHRLMTDANLQRRVRNRCPKVLYCFGLVALAPDHLRLLYALAEHIEVHFLLPNPSEAYWGDITAGRLPLTLPVTDDSRAEKATELPGEATVEAGHPLLSALGRMARDTLRLLYCDEFSAMQEPELGAPMAYTYPGEDSLLHRIQSGIVALDCHAAEQGMEDDDRSVQIHACHSPLREIQVLQDQLLDRLAHDDQLTPRDIVVMLPNVADYAPAIRTVFGGAPADRYLPFGLADRTRSASHPIVSCVTTLLDLPLSRWQASELLDLLAVPAVRRRFDIDDAELGRIEKWVEASGVRWGRDAQHRKQLQAGRFAQNSWRFGLDRLLLGVVQENEETMIDGVAPWSNLEGNNTAALGKLWHFEKTLATTAAELAEPGTPGEWQIRLNTLLDELIAPAPDDRDEQRAVDSLRQVFAGLETAETCTREITLNEDRTLSREAVRDMLHSTLGSSGERQPFLTGGITFCGLVPLRAVPFRVVCLLGLNDDAFPRQDQGRAFNVMFQQPRLSDRNTRDDDRLLFLQALVSAQDALYISYIGQDLHSGEPLPPSPIIGEILEFIHHHYFRDCSSADFRRRLIHDQPMQPFSRRYFSSDEQDPRVFTYAHHWQAATRAADAERRPLPPLLDGSAAPLAEPIETLDLDTLKRFFDHPAKAFFRERLKLQLDIEQRTVDDDEPTHLDALTAGQLRQRLFAASDSADIAQLDTAISPLEQARGTLPPPPLAAAGYATEVEAVNQLLPIWRAWHAEGTPVRTEILLDDVAGLRLSGRVGGLWSHAQRRLRTGKLKTRFRLRYWIDYLAARAMGHETVLELVGFCPDSKAPKLARYAGSIDRETARAGLTELVRLYLAGQAAPLYYHPELADKYKPNQDKALENLGYLFTSRAYHPHHLLNDPYFVLLLGDDRAPLGVDVADNPFRVAFEKINGPMDSVIRPVREESGQ